MPYSQKENEDVILPQETAEDDIPKSHNTPEEPITDAPDEENGETEETEETEANAEEEENTPSDALDLDGELAEALADTDEEENAPDKEDEPGLGVKMLSFAFDLTELFALSFAVVIIVLCFFIRHSPVSGESMTPTIQHADTLLVSDLGYTPAHGDVVIVQSLHNLEKPLVKRVIAVGGDTIEINFERWMIKVNGIVIEQRLDANGNPAKIGGDYVNYREGASMRMGSTDGADLYKIGFHYDAPSGSYVATVPEGCLFILGDNRNDSKDSRDATVGFVDERLVVGKAIYRIAPFSQMGTLD